MEHLEESANQPIQLTWPRGVNLNLVGLIDIYMNGNKIIIIWYIYRANMASLTKCFPCAHIIFNIMQCPAQILTFYKFMQTVEVVEEMNVSGWQNPQLQVSFWKKTAFRAA